MQEPQHPTSGLSGFTLDTDAWPIILVIYPPLVTQANIDLCMVTLRRRFERGRAEGVHLAVVADMRPTHIEKTTAQIREHLATSLAKVDRDFPGLAVCDAAVVTSPLIRLAISAHARFRLKRAHITRCFSTLQEARAWADLTLRSHRKTNAI